MINNLWIYFCVLAIVASTVKVLYIKKLNGSVSNFHLLFYSRLATCLAIFPVYTQISLPNNATFWWATVSAVLITIFAGYLYIEALKEGVLSNVVSIQALIPLFMLVIIGVLDEETLPLISIVLLAGLVLSTGVQLTSIYQMRNGQGSEYSKWRPIILSLFAAILYAVSTVLDKVAIESASYGAINYTFIWNLVSLLVLFILMKGKIKLDAPTRSIKWIAIVSCSSLVAFLAQQYAVENSLYLTNGVTIVKGLVMLHISVLVVLGAFLLGDKLSKVSLIASGMSVFFALGLVLTSGI